jgi:hypothetical protein
MTAHVPPPVADQLTVADFAILILGLDEHRDAMRKDG